MLCHQSCVQVRAVIARYKKMNKRDFCALLLIKLKKNREKHTWLGLYLLRSTVVFSLVRHRIRRFAARPIYAIHQLEQKHFHRLF